MLVEILLNFKLHIDDLEGVGIESVRIESEKLNFKAIIVKPGDENWIETIKKDLNYIN